LCHMELEHFQNSDYSSANRNSRRDNMIWQISVWGAEGRCARARLVPGIGCFHVCRRRLRLLSQGWPSPIFSPFSNISEVHARSIRFVACVDREIAGNDDGRFGGDNIATVSRSRVTAERIGVARTHRQPEAVADRSTFCLLSEN
jgi:hypothetical protein